MVRMSEFRYYKVKCFAQESECVMQKEEKGISSNPIPKESARKDATGFSIP